MIVKNRFVSAALAVLTTTVLASPACAQLQCAGTLSKVALHPQYGTLQIDYGYGVHYLCSVIQNEGLFTPETCKAAYSLLLSAFHAQTEVRFFFADTYTTCADLPNWAALNPSPYHISLNRPAP